MIVALFVSLMLSPAVYAQTMTAEETKQAIDKTLKSDIDYQEKLVMFMLTKDTAYFHAARTVYKGQMENYNAINKNSDKKIRDKAFSVIMSGKMALDGNKFNFDDNFMQGILNDNLGTQDNKIVFNEKEYMITKSINDKFEPIYKNWETAVKNYSDYIY